MMRASAAASAAAVFLLACAALLIPLLSPSRPAGAVFGAVLLASGFAFAGAVFRALLGAPGTRVGSLLRPIGGGALLLLAAHFIMGGEAAGRPFFQADPVRLRLLAAALFLGGAAGAAVLFARPRLWLGVVCLGVLAALRFAPDTPLAPLPRARWVLLICLAMLAFCAGRHLRAGPRAAGLLLLVAVVLATGLRRESLVAATLLDAISAQPAPSGGPGGDAAAGADIARWFGRHGEGMALAESRLGPKRREWNLLWITLCTVRADHMGFHGDSRGLTPRMDAIAGESVVFDRAYSPYPASAGSIAAMFRGWYPSQCPEIRGAGAGGLWIPDALAASGRPGIAATSLGSLALNFPFRNLLAGFAGHGPPELLRRIRAPEVLRFYRKSFEPGAGPGEEPSGTLMAGPPWFRWVFLMDAHGPYQGDPEESPAAGGAADLYAGGIRVLDRSLGEIWDGLEAAGILDRTVVVIHSDHGEAFGEHGIHGHNSAVHEPQVRIPLLIRVPGVAARRVAAPVDLVDLAPTVLDLMDLDAVREGPGDSLVPFLLGEDAPSAAVVEHRVPGAPSAGREALVFDDGFKVVVHGRGHAAEVFDLAADPGETQRRSRPELAARAKAVLEGVLRSPGRHFAASSRPAREGESPAPGAENLALAREWIATSDVRTARELDAAFHALVVQDPEAVPGALSRLLSHADPAVRWLALDALPASMGHRLAEPLGAALLDAHVRVRIRALAAIERSDPFPRESVPGGYAPSRDWEERLAFGRVLGRLGDLSRLARLARDTDAPERFRLLAVLALAEFGDGDGRLYGEALVRGTDIPPEYRLEAMRSLLRGGYGDASESMTELLALLPADLRGAAILESDRSGDSPRALLLHFMGHGDRAVAALAVDRWESLRARGRLSAPASVAYRAWTGEGESPAVLRDLGVHPRFWLPGELESSAPPQVVRELDVAGEGGLPRVAAVRVRARTGGRVSLRLAAPDGDRRGPWHPLWLEPGETILSLPVPADWGREGGPVISVEEESR